MAPKVDLSVPKIIKIRVVGGETPSSSLAQKVGPLGVPAKKVGEDIVKATVDYKGLRITVLITVFNRVATIALSPGVSTMIVKALKEPARDRKKQKNIKHHGNLPLSEIIKIGKAVLESKSLARDLTHAVKEVLGTCSSIGCSIEGKSAKEITALIESGEIVIPSGSL